MNQRLTKKIHTKFLPDIGAEITNSSDWEDRLKLLKVREEIAIQRNDIPGTFYSLNESATKYNLEYKIQRINIDEIPLSESSWWSMDSDTKYFVFYPKDFKSVRWYVAANY